MKFQLSLKSINLSINGVLSIRRISIRRIPIIGLGLGIAFGELKFGELKRNPINCVLVCHMVSQCVSNVTVFYFSFWFPPLFGMCVWHVFIKLLTYLLTYLFHQSINQ